MEMSKKRRTGAAVTEFAFVAPIFFMFLFGIFEYGRLFMTRHVMDYAAREGVRYAIVSQDTGTLAEVQAIVANRMQGFQNTFTAGTYAVDAFWIDTSNTVYHPYNTAPFGYIMGVTVKGNFKPILPVFLLWGSNSVPLTSACYMTAEAN
jgi:Flp pilus assembly protein TadG